MKKRNFKKLALLGLAGGACLLTAGCETKADGEAKDSQVASSEQLSQDALVNLLDAKTKRIFDSLDPEGKALALQLANQSCKGKNSCKGLNSCASDKNSCAGNGSCKGTSKGPFTDKNKAVQVAAKKMAEKRKAAGQ